MTTTWQIQTNGKNFAAPFAKWLDCVKILAKLHRLGVQAVMVKVKK